MNTIKGNIAHFPPELYYAYSS